MTRMIQSERLVKILAGVSGCAVLAHILFFLGSGQPLKLEDLWKLATSGCVAAGLAYLLLDHWLWKWPILQGRLIEFPDLTGTWEGTADGYTFNRRHKEVVTICHQFERIRYTSKTPNGANVAICCVLIKPEAGNISLIAVYDHRLQRMVNVNGSPHDGCCRLILSKPAKEKKTSSSWVLSGNYWTNRNRMTNTPDGRADLGTVGTITLRWQKREIED